jgi:sulfite reductase (ferredoxin)
MNAGSMERGFEVYVGGGLGLVPQQAQLFEEFVPETELLPLCQAICCVFAAHGERRNRARARMKFLLKKSGMDQFRAWVAQERAALTPDPRWTAFLDELQDSPNGPAQPSQAQPRENVRLPAPRDAEMALWLKRNVYPQRQPGFAAVTIMLPLGDLTAKQGRRLADLARKYAAGQLVTTVDQNMMLHQVRFDDLEALYECLKLASLAASGAGGIADVTSCPGTDTCKLGISASRGLAATLRMELAQAAEADDVVSGLHVKCSGCFNSCGQHHIADIGFLGVSRSVKGRRMPHFQLVVGGQWEQNGGAFGLAIGAIPSKLVPQAVARLTDLYRSERQGDESFQAYCGRIGKRELRARVEDLINAGSSGSDPSLFRDWGDPRAYTIEDMGVGECAGEVISPLEFSLAAGEQKVFEAQLALEANRVADASAKAYQAMLEAARAVVQHAVPHLMLVGNDAVIEAFREHLLETGRFETGGSRFGLHLLRSTGSEPEGPQAVHQRIEEAQMFLEAAHEYQAREMSQ